MNSRWASSKKNTILGFGKSPTSGNVSNNSDIIHSRKVEYSLPLLMRLSLSRILIMPLPQSWVSQSVMDRAGSPKNTSPPWVSSATMARMMAVMEAGLILP